MSELLYNPKIPWKINLRKQCDKFDELMEIIIKQKELSMKDKRRDDMKNQQNDWRENEKKDEIKEWKERKGNTIVEEWWRRMKRKIKKQSKKTENPLKNYHMNWKKSEKSHHIFNVLLWELEIHDYENLYERLLNLDEPRGLTISSEEVWKLIIGVFINKRWQEIWCPEEDANLGGSLIRNSSWEIMRKIKWKKAESMKEQKKKSLQTGQIYMFESDRLNAINLANLYWMERIPDGIELNQNDNKPWYMEFPLPSAQTLAKSHKDYVAYMLSITRNTLICQRIMENEGAKIYEPAFLFLNQPVNQMKKWNSTGRMDIESFMMETEKRMFGETRIFSAGEVEELAGWMELDDEGEYKEYFFNESDGKREDEYSNENLIPFNDSKTESSLEEEEEEESYSLRNYPPSEIWALMGLYQTEKMNGNRSFDGYVESDDRYYKKGFIYQNMHRNMIGIKSTDEQKLDYMSNEDFMQRYGLIVELEENFKKRLLRLALMQGENVREGKVNKAFVDLIGSEYESMGNVIDELLYSNDNEEKKEEGEGEKEQEDEIEQNQTEGLYRKSFKSLINSNLLSRKANSGKGCHEYHSSSASTSTSSVVGCSLIGNSICRNNIQIFSGTHTYGILKVDQTLLDESNEHKETVILVVETPRTMHCFDSSFTNVSGRQKRLTVPWEWQRKKLINPYNRNLNVFMRKNYSVMNEKNDKLNSMEYVEYDTFTMEEEEEEDFNYKEERQKIMNYYTRMMIYYKEIEFYTRFGRSVHSENKDRLLEKTLKKIESDKSYLILLENYIGDLKENLSKYKNQKYVPGKFTTDNLLHEYARMAKIFYRFISKNKRAIETDLKRRSEILSRSNISKHDQRFFLSDMISISQYLSEGIDIIRDINCIQRLNTLSVSLSRLPNYKTIEDRFKESQPREASLGLTSGQPPAHQGSLDAVKPDFRICLTAVELELLAYRSALWNFVLDLLTRVDPTYSSGRGTEETSVPEEELGSASQQQFFDHVTGVTVTKDLLKKYPLKYLVPKGYSPSCHSLLYKWLVTNSDDDNDKDGGKDIMEVDQESWIKGIPSFPPTTKLICHGHFPDLSHFFLSLNYFNIMETNGEDHLVPYSKLDAKKETWYINEWNYFHTKSAIIDFWLDTLQHHFGYETEASFLNGLFDSLADKLDDLYKKYPSLYYGSENWKENNGNKWDSEDGCLEDDHNNATTTELKEEDKGEESLLIDLTQEENDKEDEIQEKGGGEEEEEELSEDTLEMYYILREMQFECDEYSDSSVDPNQFGALHKRRLIEETSLLSLNPKYNSQSVSWKNSPLKRRRIDPSIQIVHSGKNPRVVDMETEETIQKTKSDEIVTGFLETTTSNYDSFDFDQYTNEYHKSWISSLIDLINYLILFRGRQLALKDRLGVWKKWINLTAWYVNEDQEIKKQHYHNGIHGILNGFISRGWIRSNNQYPFTSILLFEGEILGYNCLFLKSEPGHNFVLYSPVFPLRNITEHFLNNSKIFIERNADIEIFVESLKKYYQIGIYIIDL